jgi:hypothetical protein
MSSTDQNDAIEFDAPMPLSISHRDQSPPARAMTHASSTATLVHLVESHDHDDISHQPTIAEVPAGTTTTPLTTTPPSGAADDRPPPVLPPDIVSFFDPASVGGGGPLKRITTQQRERAEAEARERAQREAQGLPPDGEGGILNRLRSSSNASRRLRPRFTIPLMLDEEHHTSTKYKPNLSPTLSSKTVAPTPGKEDTEFNLQNAEPKKDEESNIPGDVEAQPQVTVDTTYPDGGYGWVVLICCLALAGTTMGWGMNWGVFQEVSR